MGNRVTPATMPELLREMQKEIRDLKLRRPPVIPDVPASQKPIVLGTVAANYTSGPAQVAVTGVVGTRPMWPMGDYLPKSGEVVLVFEHEGVFYIDAASRPTLAPRKIKLVLQNGFRQYNTRPDEYMHGSVTEADGIISLDGLITVPAAGIASGQVIAQLPPGFEPSQQLMFGCNVSDTWRCIDIRANGQIVTAQALSGGVYISLAGIAWPKESVVASTGGWSIIGAATSSAPSKFQNGWDNYLAAPAYGQARYWLDPITSMVWVQGLVKGGTLGQGTVLATMPASHGAKRINHIATASADNMGAVYGTPTAGLQVLHSYAAWLTLSGMVYEAASSTKEWIPHELSNGWINYNVASYTPGSYRRSPNGMVYHQGLITAGSIAMLGRVQYGYRKGDGAQVGSAALYNRMANLARARVDIFKGDVIAQQGSGVWFSLDALVYAADF